MSNYMNQTYSGRYKILEELPNQNDYEFYFKGRDLQTNKDVQFRIIPIYKDNPTLTEQSQQFIFKELNLMKKLKFKGLPNFVDSISNENENIIITDYQDGRSLEEYLKKTPQLSEQDTLEFLNKLLPIIRYLHSQEPPVIYRDLQPKNIFINVNGDVYLAKYEAARTYKADKVKDTFVVSTRGYNPPEQALGKGQSDPKSDIFSIGMIIFQMLTGKDPTTSLILPKVSDIRKDISPIWTQLVSKATNIKQDKRYVSIDELMTDLHRIQSGSLDYNPAQGKISGAPAQKPAPVTPKPGLSVKTATGAQAPRPAVVAAPKPVQIQTPQQARPNVQAPPIARPNVQAPVVGRPTVQPVVQHTQTPVIARPNIQQTRPTETPVVQQPQQTNVGSVTQPTIQQPVVNTPPTQQMQSSGVGQEPPKANPVMRLIAIALFILALIVFFVSIPIPFLGGIIKYVVGAILIVVGAIFFFLGKPKV